MEKMEKEIKEYDELVKNEINEEDNLSISDNSDNYEFDYNKDNNNNITSNIEIDTFKKFKVYFYLEYDKDFKYVFPIESESFNIEKQYVYELIKNIVKIINNNNYIINYKSTNYVVSLKDCENSDYNFYINNYEIRPCKKKNFFPKNDLPQYSTNSLLKDIIYERISFVSKNALNIMLFEKYDEEIENIYEDKSDQNIINNNNIDIINTQSINKYHQDESTNNNCFIF